MKKGLKKVFSVLAVTLILASQSPLGSLLGISSGVHAEDITTQATDFTVTAPNGSEVWNGSRTITWTTTSASTGVDIWYCAGTDCANASYTLIAANQPNNLSYTWSTTTA